MTTTLGLQLAFVVACYLVFVGVTSTAWQFIVPQSPQLNALDVLRGLCASLVFVVHAIKTQSVFIHGAPYELTQPLKALVPLGDVGISVFFFITGYLFFGVAYPKTTGLTAAALFLSKRLRRLGPAFFAVALCALALHLWAYAGSLSVMQALEDTVRIFSFGAFRGDLTTRDPLMWNAINMAWTLEFEWIFYLAIGSSMVMGGHRIAALIVVLLVAVLHWVLTDQIAGAQLFLYFVVGGLVHHLRSHTLGLMVVAVAVYFLGGKWALISYFLFWGATLVKTVPKVLVPFATAGNITYSYYLFHGLVLLAVYRVGDEWWGPFELDNSRLFVFGVLAAALASLVSLLIYRVAELPYFLRRAQ